MWDTIHLIIMIRSVLTGSMIFPLFRGFGSVLSFGLTDVINNATGASSVVNKCSGFYKAGNWSGIGLSAAFGAAHLGRNAFYQMGSGGLRQGSDV